MNKVLLVILGPTAVGKTQAAIEVAEHLSVPIINADSRQIYRELPIGTAAPTLEERKRVEHYFVGTKALEDYYSASLFQQDATQLLKSHLFREADVAVMSGGSMMYIDAVCNGIDEIPTINDEIRSTLKRRYEEEGLQALLKELQEKDEEYYNIVDRKNPRRVIHALEVCLQTGNTYTSYRKKNNTEENHKRDFDIIKIGLNLPREVLFDRINRRTEKMIEEGFINEAKTLYPQRGLNALNTVGYKEMFNYFDGNMTLSDTISRIQKNTRVYAKKQLTWFKKDESIKWCLPQEALTLAQSELNRIR